MKDPSAVLQSNHPLYPHVDRLERCLLERDGERYYLRPDKLRRWFEGLMTKVLDKLPVKQPNDPFGIEKVSPRKSGPSFELGFRFNDGSTISVDFVPVFQLPCDLLRGLDTVYEVLKSRRGWVSKISYFPAVRLYFSYFFHLFLS